MDRYRAPKYFKGVSLVAKLTANTTGVLIAGIPGGGLANRAGIKPGDVLIKSNGRDTRDIRQQAGENIAIEILRKGKS